MSKQLQRKVVFALLMGVVTTGIVSFVLIALNLGLGDRFLRIWLRSWAVGYLLAIPAILVIGPRGPALVARRIPQT